MFLSYILIVKLWLWLQAVPRGQEHRQASDCCWAVFQKNVPSILRCGGVIWIKWIPSQVAITSFCLKMLCTKRRTLFSKSLLPWVGNPTHVSVWPYNSPGILGWRTSQDARATPKKALGIFLILMPLYQIDQSKHKLGLKVNWCPEIKMLTDVCRQNALYYQ